MLVRTILLFVKIHAINKIPSEKCIDPFHIFLTKFFLKKKQKCLHFESALISHGLLWEEHMFHTGLHKLRKHKY